MNELDVFKYIATNLSKPMQNAMQGTHWTEEVLAGIVMRETGELIARWAPKTSFPILCSLMRGDYTKRPHDESRCYHGYGFTQIDVDSFPQFVKSGDWKIPDKVFPMTIQILEAKRGYLLKHAPGVPDLNLYTIAAYNCGEGNEAKVINQKLDVDAFTTGHNYAKDVILFSDTYKKNCMPVSL